MRVIPCPCCDCPLQDDPSRDQWYCAMCDYTWDGLVLQNLSLQSVLAGTNRVPQLVEGKEWRGIWTVTEKAAPLTLKTLDKAFAEAKNAAGNFKPNIIPTNGPLYHLAGDLKT